MIRGLDRRQIFAALRSGIDHGYASARATSVAPARTDLAAGLNTAGFISGYRGSPLGGYDKALWSAQDLLKQNHIVFRAGVNEELAATAIWGTQQVGVYPGPKYDGVFAIWYGKGPGVDRAGDALKHGNLSGAAKHGGVLVVFGDDHSSKSSTIPHQSEQALAANFIPVLYPATVQEYIDFGLLDFGDVALLGDLGRLQVRQRND